MTATSKKSLRRFVGFSLCNAPGTLVELLLVWLFSTYLFRGYWGQYVVAPLLAFECAMLTDFVLFFFFVWHDNIADHSPRAFFRRLAAFNLSTAGVYGLRIGVIQLLKWCFGLNVVLCDLLSMAFSGLLNFVINEKVVFASRRSRHRWWVRLLMLFVRPFVRLRIVGRENIPATGDAPVVYVCNHGFIYGPVAAVFNLPDTFRPWIHSRMLDARECFDDLCGTFRNSFRLFGRRVQRHILARISHAVVAVLKDFNPIPVFKGGTREVVRTLQQSVDALVDGTNLLIFPEHPRTDYQGDLRTERREATHLRSFYSGFAEIGRSFYEKTGQALRFVPVYIDRKTRTLRIAPAVAYEYTGDRRADRMALSDKLYSALSALR